MPYKVVTVRLAQHLVCLDAADHVCINQWAAGQATECLGLLHSAVPGQHHLCCCSAHQFLWLRVVLGRSP